jgi:putative DNA primase/helicase
MHIMERQKRKSYQELKADARGKWAYIFEELAPDLAQAMAAHGTHVSCPVHGGSDGFRLYKDYPNTGGGVCNTCGNQPTGFGMLAFVRGYDFKDAIKDVSKWIDGEFAAPTIIRRPPPAAATPPDPSKAQAAIRYMWTTSVELKGSAAQRYLAARGIWAENHPQTLRAHPGLDYYDSQLKKYTGTYPAMLAPVKNPKGVIVALHRTFLTADGGKAPVVDAKKLSQKIEPLGGAAIKLFPSTDVLGVGEGIETMLAVRAITRLPVWSAVSAVLLEQVEIPESVRHVVIWADKDAKGRGQEAAQKLSDRLIAAGKSVEIQIPTAEIPEGAKGIDWLDVLLNHGLEGFPERWRLWKP